MPSPLTVLTTSNTHFYGLSGLAALSGSAAVPLRVVGFVLIDSTDPYTSARGPVFLARSVEAITSK